MTEAKRVGLIGVGRMGHGIAANLLRHGHRLGFLAHPGNRPVDDLIASGAQPFARAAELASASDALILCVTGSPEVEDVVLGPGGVLAGMRPGTIVVDCSTAIPASTLRVAAAIEAAGGAFLDAPMTRTPKEAAQGRLNLLVGGDPALLERVRPLLACFAENLVPAGPVGAGHRLKLLHNYVSLGFATVLAEAAACARRVGVDAGIFVDVLAAGGGNGVVLERMRPFIESGDDSRFLFTLSNASKDLDYYTAMAREAGAAAATATAVGKTLAQAARGHPQLPVPALVELLAVPT